MSVLQVKDLNEGINLRCLYLIGNLSEVSYHIRLTSQLLGYLLHADRSRFKHYLT